MDTYGYGAHEAYDEMARELYEANQKVDQYKALVEATKEEGLHTAAALHDAKHEIVRLQLLMESTARGVMNAMGGPDPITEQRLMAVATTLIANSGNTDLTTLSEDVEELAELGYSPADALGIIKANEEGI